MRLEKESFGPVLRASRQRKGITLEQIAAETKLGVELWADLEENNLSRWPKQIYARSYVRDYAERVGLDADEIVNEFCRLFPDWGDRRAERVMRGHAAIVNHDLHWQDLPTKEERRAEDRLALGQQSFYGRHKTRIFAALFDLAVPLVYAASGVVLGFKFWPALALSSIAYNLTATLFSTRGFGLVVSEWLMRILAALPVARRRLVSSRAGHA